MTIFYGGAFNPPTKAHIEIVNLILETYKNSKVVIVPVGNSYGKNELIDFKFRYEMLKLVFDNERIIISDLEKDKAFDGTINSLDELSKTYKDLSFVIGSDNIIDLDKWIMYEKLLKTYPLIIIKRAEDDVDFLLEKYKNIIKKYDILEFGKKINSSMIRKDLKNHLEWLDPKIIDYIRKYNLYEEWRYV